MHKLRFRCWANFQQIVSFRSVQCCWVCYCPLLNFKVNGLKVNKDQILLIRPCYPSVYVCTFINALLGKAGRPKEALTIYVHVLDDLETARAFCKETGAWQHLVELLVQPPDQVRRMFSQL